MTDLYSVFIHINVQKPFTNKYRFGSWLWLAARYSGSQMFLHINNVLSGRDRPYNVGMGSFRPPIDGKETGSTA